MGNNPSAHSRNPNSSSSSPSGHESAPKTHSRRGDPRSLIQSQRTAAEASLAQARGTTHRPRPSQSSPVTPLNQPSPSHSISSPSQHSTESQVPSPMGVQQSKEEPKVEAQDIPSRPKAVSIPTPLESPPTQPYSHSIEPSGPSTIPDMYHLTRPPRLPLPIEEEVHTPGSPIIAPTDNDPTDNDVPALDGVEALDGDTLLPRRASALSNTTVDEEDAEELRVDKSGTTVPTTLEWQQGGEKVYVTGTIFQWNKKHRLHRVDGQPGLFRTVVNVPPGTHHVRFIVDNVMQCSTHLPTTVDFGNNLVNYIEVSADDLPRPGSDSKEPSVPATTDVKDHAVPSSQARPQVIEEDKSKAKPKSKTRPAPQASRYTSEIPQYLLDLDKAEETEAYKYAAAAIEKLPTPPSLPGFLGKPILNAATPMKDDNSVLTMPNHTVLNHLATSSIKNNVLAVSATTRYRRKYVTTIMYKPTGDE